MAQTKRENYDRYRLCCTREKGHDGPHKACGLDADEHNLEVWERTGEMSTQRESGVGATIDGLYDEQAAER